MIHHRMKVSSLYKYFVIVGIVLVVVLNALAILVINHNMDKVTVELKGDTYLLANVNDDYTDPGINVSRHGYDLKYEVKKTNNVDISKFGTYTYEYEV